jgi:hypothetical protein
MSKPDFTSYTYNYRQQRFSPIRYEYDPERGNKWAAFPVSIGVLPETNDQIELTSDNKLVIQLFDEDHDTGFHVDSVGSIYGRWLMTLKSDRWRSDAIKCNNVGLVLLDDRAVEQTKNYSDSEPERLTPPDMDILPTEQEWMEIWHRAKTALIKRAVGK